MSDIRASVESVSPMRAADFLKFNAHNRPISQARVDRYAHDIATGSWELNGEPIIIGPGGELLDGQHRLLAIQKSGRTVDVLVVRGVQEGAFRTIDSGTSRNFGDVLSIERGKDKRALATAVRVLHTFIVGTPLTYAGKTPITPSGLSKLLKSHPQLEDSCNFVATRSNEVTRAVASNAVLSVLHYLFSKVDPTLANRYVEDLMLGTNLRLGEPIQVLRERLLTKGIRGGHKQLRPRDRAALIIKVWLILRGYREMPEQLSFKGGTRKGAEQFPEIL